MPKDINRQICYCICRDRERLKGKDPFKDRDKSGPKGPPIGKSIEDEMAGTGGGKIILGYIALAEFISHHQTTFVIHEKFYTFIHIFIH